MIKIIGAGLAGYEAAWQVATRGFHVRGSTIFYANCKYKIEREINNK